MTADFPVTKDWVVAGKAIFTVFNGKGDHYTYQVKRKNNDDSGRLPVWFVSLLTGPDNGSDYTYLGCLSSVTGTFRTTRASRMTSESIPVQVFSWAMRIIWSGINTTNFPAGYGIKGEGRCGRCGRRLTHPNGIAYDGYRRGFGPECYSKL
jgi:hypothetical protein